ncbi:MAG: hypothetical protein HY052_03880 [Proteobacteria bacterium]|nr:hypothetical protein [Pseudomonadota bacterium]
MVRFIGEKRTSDEFKRYRLTFKIKGGRLFIAGFQEIGNDGKPLSSERQ